MPKGSYTSMSACLSDYKGMKGAKATCKAKVKPLKNDSDDLQPPPVDPRAPKEGGSY